MSVYKPSKSRFYHFDFQYRGRRFHGSTGCETRRKAEEVERRRRAEAALGQLDDAAQMTLNAAADRWWMEVGRHLKTADAVEARIARLLGALDPALRLAEITTAHVSQAMEKRRRQPYTRATIARKRKGKSKARQYMPKNRTVNLDIISTLRPILNQARAAWGARGLPGIDWKKLKLPEPKPKPRELIAGDEAALEATLLPHWQDFARFQARYGPRISEMFWPLDAMDIGDPQSARITLRGRKGDDDHIIPILPEDVPWLAARLGRARAAKLPTIWFRVLKGGRIKAVTYHGAESAIRRAMTTSGLRASKGLKGSHDFRRNAAMKTLRASGNLRVTQRLLGHASIQSTLVYAHALEDDVKVALAQVSRNSPEPQSPEAAESQSDQKPRRA